MYPIGQPLGSLWCAQPQELEAKEHKRQTPAQRILSHLISILFLPKSSCSWILQKQLMALG